MTPREYVLGRLAGVEPPPLREFLAAEVEAHQLGVGALREVRCEGCGGRIVEGEACSWLTRLAASLGYEGGGGYGSDEPDERALADADDAQRLLSSPSAEAAEPHAEGEPGLARGEAILVVQGSIEDRPDAFREAVGAGASHVVFLPDGAPWLRERLHVAPPVSAPAQGVGE